MVTWLTTTCRVGHAWWSFYKRFPLYFVAIKIRNFILMGHVPSHARENVAVILAKVDSNITTVFVINQPLGVNVDRSGDWLTTSPS